MKALRNYGDGLKIDDNYEHPSFTSPGENEIIIKVHATAITAAELTWPETVTRENPIPGHDVAGTIVSMGSKVAGFKEGDEVFALTSFSREGSAAEYGMASASQVALKPTNLTWAEAASIPLAALTAKEAIWHAELKRGQKVLITGAGGRRVDKSRLWC